MQNFFLCENCGMQFLAKKNLTKHKMIMHLIPKKKHKTKEVTENLFKCEFCSKTFDHQSTLSSHLKKHKKSYVRSILKMVLKNFKNHVISPKHSKNSTHSCQDDQVKTSSPVSSVNHQRKRLKLNKIVKNTKEAEFLNSSQTNQTPSICKTKFPKNSETKLENKKCELAKPLLNDSLVGKSIRNNRLKISSYHLERTFVCNVCQKGFYLRKNLKIHKISHFHPQYPCKDCNFKFKTLCALIDHRDQLHPDEKKTQENDKFTVACSQKNSLDKTVSANDESKSQIYIRQSASEDPHLWPKVSLSKNLNDLLMFPINDLICI